MLFVNESFRFHWHNNLFANLIFLKCIESYQKIFIFIHLRLGFESFVDKMGIPITFLGLACEKICDFLDYFTKQLHYNRRYDIVDILNWITNVHVKISKQVWGKRNCFLLTTSFQIWFAEGQQSLS